MSFYRRRLPHWHPEDAWIFLTWRLHGSLPKQTNLTTNGNLTDGQRFVQMDRILDRAATGPRWLSEPAVADAVANVILEQESKWHMYDLAAWVIMPNHVHLLINPHHRLPVVTRALKNNSARLANQILNRTGHPFWQDESFDRWIRRQP